MQKTVTIKPADKRIYSMIIHVDVHPIFEIICQNYINVCSNVSYYLIILSPNKTK